MKTRFHTRLTLLACTLAMAGCVSGKYAVDDLSGQLGYTNEIRQQYAVDDQWWTRYGNADLNRLIRIALANNPDYIKAAININRELANLNLATADLFPTLSGDLGASSRRAVFDGGHSANNFSGELGLTYEVDLYGKIRDARSAQAFELKATVMDREAARLTLVNSVIDLYYNLEYLHNTMELTRANIQLYHSMRDIALRKKVLGKTDGLEPAQAEQNLLSEQKRLLDLETQSRDLEQSLNNILAAGPGSNHGLRFGNILRNKTLKANINVPLAVLANRPDLNASQYRLEKAFKNLQAEEKNWYPGISIQGAIDSSSNRARSTFDVPYAFGSVAVSLPFLDWSRVKNRVDISEADYQTAVVDFRDTLNRALNEVAYYYYAYQKSVQIFDNTKLNHDRAREIASYYKLRYDMGKAEYKDYLEALNTEQALQKDLVAQKYQVIKYENYIYKAMAGRYTGK